jgi:hypothetical protein
VNRASCVSTISMLKLSLMPGEPHHLRRGRHRARLCFNSNAIALAPEFWHALCD